jgi:hypothetical protein
VQQLQSQSAIFGMALRAQFLTAQQRTVCLKHTISTAAAAAGEEQVLPDRPAIPQV